MISFKVLRKLVIIAAIFILSMVLSGCDSLQINNLIVNTTINKDGSVKMEEKISFHFSDGKESISKNIYFPNGSEVKDLSVSDNKGENYKLVSSISDSEISKVYTKTNTSSNLVTLEIYSPDDVEDETYDVTYTLANIATKYKDSGHFVWTYVGKSTDVSLGNVSVNINFEESINKDEIQVDLNGPLNKNVQVDNNGIKTSVNNFPTDTLYEASILFPNSYISKSSKVSEDTIKDKVQTIEDQWKAYDSARITNKKIHNNSMVGILVASILFLIFFYLKFCRGVLKEEGFKLYKELPMEYSPAVMRRFLNGRIKTIDVAATAFDLVRRGHLKYFQDIYTFKAAKPISSKGRFHEGFFITFFLNTIGKRRSLVVREIETKKINSTEAKKIREDYKGWKRKVDLDVKIGVKAKNSSKKPLIIAIIFSITIILVTLILSLVVHKSSPMILINIIVALYIIYFAIVKGKKIDEDVLYNRYMGFKAFLKDKDALIEVVHNDISLAEKYLPYAITLGVHKEFLDILKNNIHNKNIQGFENLTYLKLNDEYYFQGVSNVIDIIEGYLNDALDVNQ